MASIVTSRLIRPVLLTVALLAAAWIAGGAPLPAAQASVAARPAGQSQLVGQGQNRAAVAVKFDDGRTESRCVAFDEQDIGGDELLERSGLLTEMSPEGAVCSIDGLGCRPDDCFCQCASFHDCQYWAFYQWEGGSWMYSQWGVAADTVVVTHGVLHGWSWGTGDNNTGAPPPDVTYEDVCTFSTTSASATPTVTVNVDTAPPATQPPAPASAPQVTFSAATQSVLAQQCTTLSWSTFDATAVTLDGIAKAFSGTEQVCPTSSRMWTLIATNGAGQTVRQVSIQVTGAASPAGSLGGTSIPALPTLVRPIMQATLPLPPAGQDQQGTLPTPASGFSPLPPGAFEGSVPLAPTAESPQALFTTAPPPATPTRYMFGLPPTETPRPRRMLGADGGPTPTPLLVARAGAGAGGSPATTAGNNSPAAGSGSGQMVQSRAFSPQLLPGYAAYIVTVAILLLMGWYALRRRNGHTTVTVTQWARDDARVSRRTPEE